MGKEKSAKAPMRTSPSRSENAKMLPISSRLSSLFWMMPAPSPMSDSRLKKVVNTMATATTPKSSGTRIRASAALKSRRSTSVE